MKKTVGIDAHVLGDHSGGNESYYKNLINHFQPDEQIRLVVFVKPDYDIRQIGIQCDIVRFKSKNPLIRNFIEIPKLVKKYNIDLLHMQYFIPFYVSCKVIVTIHDISFEHFKDIFTKKDYVTQKILIPYAAKHSDVIFTVSEFSRNDIIEHYHVPMDKVVVTYNGAADVYTEWNSAGEAKSVLEKYGIIRPYILTVGNLQPRKNLRRLIKAYVRLMHQNGAKTDLVIVGKKAWMYEDLFSEIEESGLKSHIILTDYVEEQDMPAIYRSARIFVYPSYFEGFGIPVLEAMYCGTPVATSNCTSLPEVVGAAGLLFNPMDVDDIMMKMKKLLESDDLRSKLRVRGMERAEQFSWMYTADTVMDVYKKHLLV